MLVNQSINQSRFVRRSVSQRNWKMRSESEAPVITAVGVRKQTHKCESLTLYRSCEWRWWKGWGVVGCSKSSGQRNEMLGRLSGSWRVRPRANSCQMNEWAAPECSWRWGPVGNSVWDGAVPCVSILKAIRSWIGSQCSDRWRLVADALYDAAQTTRVREFCTRCSHTTLWFATPYSIQLQ